MQNTYASMVYLTSQRELFVISGNILLIPANVCAIIFSALWNGDGVPLREEVRLMLEIVLAIGFTLICLAIVLHESNKKN